MIKLNKNIFMIAVLLVGTIGFASCSSAPTTTNPANTAIVNTNTANVNTTVTNTNAENTNTIVVKTEPGDEIGIPECDEYIAKYEACINNKVPEAQRGAFKTSFDSIRKGWKEAAANPQTKPSLASGCKQAIETAKVSMAPFSCAW